MPTLPSRETLRTILSSPQAARTELQRRRVPTGTDGDLLAFVEETFGLRMALLRGSKTDPQRPLPTDP